MCVFVYLNKRELLTIELDYAFTISIYMFMNQLMKSWFSWTTILVTQGASQLDLSQLECCHSDSW